MFLLYPVILTLGFATSYTDIKFKKIKNIHLFLAVPLGLSAHVYLISTHQTALNINFGWNLLIGFGIGMLLYLTDTWGAGDAKLFAVYCLLMPTEKYSRILFFPSIALFTNIFIISTLAMFVCSLQEILRDRTKILIKIFSWSTAAILGKSFLAIFSLKWIIQSAITRFAPQSSPFFSIIGMFLAYRLIMFLIHKFHKNFIIYLIFASAIATRVLLDPVALSMSTLFLHIKTSLAYTLLFHILSIIFDLNQAEKESVKIIPFAPFMLIGTLLTNTNFLNWILQILRAVRK